MVTATRSPIGEILHLVREPVLPDPFEEYTTVGVRSFGKGVFHYPRVVGAQLGKLRFYSVRPGELIISNIKAWEGAVSVTTHADAGTIASNRFLTYRAKDDRQVNLNFIRYYFLTEEGNALLGHASPGSADRNRTLAIDRFERLAVPIPDITAQNRTAAYLDRVLGRRAAAFGAFAEQGPEAFLRALPPIVAEELSKVAAGSTTVRQLADIISDVIHPGDDPGPAEDFIGLEHIESHTGRRVGARPIGAEKGRKFRFRKGDVLYGYLRPYLNKVWVADRPGLCSVDQYVLRPNGIRPGLLAHLLRSAASLRQAIDFTHNLQLPRLRSALLLALEVPAVAPDSQAATEERLDRLVDRMATLAATRRAQRRVLEAVGDSALNRAFADLG